MSYTCTGVIFDLDGVLIDSHVVVERHWRRWAAQHGLDGDAVMAFVHGRPMIQSMRHLTPHLDAETEGRALAAAEAADTDGLVRIDGAVALTQALPHGRWGIATSGDRPTATTRVRYIGVPWPAVLITADDVTQGKPHPEPYLKAAAGLDLAPDTCLVFEDSPAGITAAKAAGMQVVGVATTHRRDDLTHADIVIDRLAQVQAAVNGAAITLHLNGA